ncbi:MAG: tetratricopeptide repeat protein [Armatimonadota bacterium]
MLARRLLIPLLLLTLATFAGALGHDLLRWSDEARVHAAAALQLGVPDGYARLWEEPCQGRYAPVARTVWWLLARLSVATSGGAEEPSLQPALFHAANLALHLANVLLVFAILQRLVRNGWPAFAGALLFALHPAQVEAVAWVSGLPVLMGGLLALLALWQYLAYAQASGQGRPRAPVRAHYAAGTACFVLALLSHPLTAAAPLMALALDRGALRRPWRKALVGVVPWLALAAGGALLAWWAERAAELPPPVVPVWARPLIAADALGFSLGTLALPVRLAPDYARTPRWVLEIGWAHGAWLTPLAVGLVVWLLRRRWPWLVTAALVLLGGMLPTLGLVPFSAQMQSTVADRYLYLALLGPAYAEACWLRVRRPRWVWAICWALLITAGVLSAAQVGVWRDDRTLYQHALEVRPESAPIQTGMGALLLSEGQAGAAAEHLRAAVRLDPSAERYLLLAQALDREGRVAGALAASQEAAMLAPDDAGVQAAVGRRLMALGRADEAITAFQAALGLEPQDVETRHALARVLSVVGQHEEAAGHLQIVARAQPEAADVRYELALELVKSGRRTEALDQLGVALRLRPAFPEAQGLLRGVLERMEADAFVPDTGP